MSTLVVPSYQNSDLSVLRRTRSAASGVYPCTVLTAIALVIHGYHPYAEDGGIYIAGIKKVLNPQLYPYWSGFVTAHLHFSLFAYMVAILVRHLPMGFMATILLLYIGCIWLTLFASWQVLNRLTPSLEAHYGAVSLLSLWLTVPVAGTSLMLMDPYVTSRSLATPCALLAVAGALDLRTDLEKVGPASWQSIGLCGGSLAFAALVHPLMAAYASGLVLLLLADSFSNLKLRRSAMGSIVASAIGVAACICLLCSPAAADYAYVARTRTYWFINSWRWYEQFGLIAPLSIFGAFTYTGRFFQKTVAKSVALVSLIAGLTGLLVAALFARVNSPNYLVARLQPLRMFQILYVLMILFVGGWLGDAVLRRDWYRWLTVFLVFGSVMYTVQERIYPNSNHLEVPWGTTKNGWQQAFLWIRDHTPVNAKFAIAANYVALPGEDSQNFRAVAERSVLPDYSKDGGVTALSPDLAAAWTNGQRAQSTLETDDDEKRARDLGSQVDFVVLTSNASTNLRCIYRNDFVKVCRLVASF